MCPDTLKIHTSLFPAANHKNPRRSRAPAKALLLAAGGLGGAG